MKKYLHLSLLFFAVFSSSCTNSVTKVKNDYMIVAQQAIETDPEWLEVVTTLQEKHNNAPVFYYQNTPREAMSDIRRIHPRYIAFIDKPENLGRDYVMDLHRMSRTVDDDIFADFIWGIITGYDVKAALKMVNNSTAPLVVKDAVATIMELNSGKWFDRYGYIDDHTKGLWGYKNKFSEPVANDTVAPEEVLKKFYDLYTEYTPDLVVTAAHATERNLEMPFSLGNIKARDGKLYADFENDPQFLKESGKRKVYFAVGNCLIGNVNKTKESMAVAWMNSGNATAMIGYVVTTWHGRNGWGGLKYWVTNPGRYSLQEAIYLNQQDFLYQQSKWSPDFLKLEYPFDHGDCEFRTEYKAAFELLKEKAGIENPTKDQVGFLHDRDVLAYYGDPKWDIRLQEVPEETDFTVNYTINKNQCIITIQTANNFSLARMSGDKFKEEHVLDIPFSYFFPERLRNPRLAEGQNWDAVVDENFIFVYDPSFKPGKTYEIKIDVN